MKKGLFLISSSILSLIVGSAFGYFIGSEQERNKCKKICDDAIEDMKKYYENKYGLTKTASSVDKTYEYNIDGRNVAKATTTYTQEDEKYNDIVSDLKYKSDNHKDYTNYSTKKYVEDTDEKQDRPFIIPYEKLGDCDYDIVSMDYYEDDILLNNEGQIEKAVDDVVGYKILDYFKSVEDTTIAVRNDFLKIDMEIMKHYEKYYN